MNQSGVKQWLGALASLKLTVALFAMAMFLIFAGTLAQVEQGIWTVMRQYFRSFIVWIDLQLFVPTGLFELPGRFPFPGGFIVGGLLLANLVAAHTLRFKLTPKRAGVVVLHAGVIVLLIGELVTALWAREGNMSIDEGSYASYTENIRQTELAIIDPADPKADRVVVVPQPLLQNTQGQIANPLLPFEVSVDRWMANSQLLDSRNAPPALAELTTLADQGLGKQLVAQPQPQISGVESQTVDAPSAYITLWQEGQKLGTWLVSLYIDDGQPVEIDGKIYTIGLRFKRTYKPYTVHLIDFKHDKFVGTDKPRNFSSLVRLVDPQQHEDREVLIYMNNPLRYRGETFYQSAFKPDNSGTVLQVVRNPGYVLPYIACILVALGMSMHFGLHLHRFVRRPAP